MALWSHLSRVCSTDTASRSPPALEAAPYAPGSTALVPQRAISETLESSSLAKHFRLAQGFSEPIQNLGSSSGHPTDSKSQKTDLCLHWVWGAVERSGDGMGARIR